MWLFGVCGMVFSIVVVGGLTRLTKSGLSMVTWRPQGSLPPLNDAEWEAEFDKYKQYPEYAARGSDLSMSQFKYIFYWEWGHRMIGRCIGFAFVLPMAYFAMRGKRRRERAGGKEARGIQEI